MKGKYGKVSAAVRYSFFLGNITQMELVTRLMFPSLNCLISFELMKPKAESTMTSSYKSRANNLVLV